MDDNDPVQRSGRSPGQISILVIDDDPNVLFATSRILRGAGFSVMEGQNAADAIKLTQERRPALVLLDVNLPDGNGVDVALQIKKDPALSSVFVVLCSGERISSQDQVDGFERGLADGYILRPVGKDELIARIDAFIRIRAVQEALRESDDLFRGLFDNANDAIFLHDLLPDGKPGRYTKVNNIACQRLGYTRDELLGMSPYEIVSQEHQLDMPQIARLIQEEGHGTFDAVHRRKDGTKFPVEISTNILELHGKKAALSIARDITERKLAEEALALANKKLNLLSGITRHDINNQLTVLAGYLRILEKKQPDTTHNKYFQKIATAAQRISAMVQFTKEYEEIGVKAPTWQDIRILVDTAAKQAPLGKVTVMNNIPSGTEVFADPLVVKVFYNLMDNAARYGGNLTTIRFSVGEAGDDQVIVCEDDGDGIIAEEKEKIFERGFGKNTGLGLALSREILAITGITITETGEPGKGARFEMVVPKGMFR
ncbi:MAG: PAS domain S-box protein [Methanomicrobiales archaeon]